MSPLARRVLWVCLLVGSTLRLLLFGVNPPTNAFDDHYRPIALLLETGRLPAAGDCWECYHPPAFYAISAGVAVAGTAAGLEPLTVQKLVQFMPCFYGILTLVVLEALLRRLKLPDLPLCVAFATACFLPRHIYMSAIHSNDTIAYLGVTTCLWLMLRTLDKGLSAGSLLGLAAAMAVTVMTKYTSLVVLPMVLASFGAAWLWRLPPGRLRLGFGAAAVCAPAVIALALFAWPNVREYGRPFPSNLEIFHDEWLDSGRGERDVHYFDFDPWGAIATPILSPDTRDSLWTVLWARTFFDMEPRFLPYTDPASVEWWEAYERFLGGADDAPWPGMAALSAATVMTGSLLIALGLLPLVLLLVGLLRCLLGRWRILLPPLPDRPLAARLAMVPVLVLGVMAGIVLTTWKFPYTFSMKSVYVLNALPACVIAVALGTEWVARRSWARQIVQLGTMLLALTCTWHVLTLVIAMIGA